MPYNGILGLNVRTLGVSRDMTISAVRQLNSAFVLVHDDPDLVAQLSSMGVRCVYRQSNDETLSLAPDAFVRERAKNAPTATFLHTTNELDPTPELLEWTLEGIKYADTIGRKLCIFNFSTHRTFAQWEQCLGVARQATANGHAVGAHVYSRFHSDRDAIHFVSQRRRFGGTCLITEFGYALDAHHGWRGTLSEQAYADFCAAWLPAFAEERMPALLFSYDHWTANEEGKAHGFGVNDAPQFLSAVAALNRQYPIQEGTPVPPPIPHQLQPGVIARVAATYVNVRATPTTDAPILRRAYPGSLVQYDPTPVQGGEYTVGGVRSRLWYSLDLGYMAAGAATITPVVLPPVPAPTPYALGIDVSGAGQTSVRWRDVQEQGYSFGIIRATQGVVNSKPVGADTRFREFIDGALAAGMDVGAYHSLIASVDGMSQADFFYVAIAPYLDRLAFPPVIDVELTNGQSPQTIANRLRAMCMQMEVLTGQKPMIYTNVGFWNSKVGSQWDSYFSTLPLWTAHWTTAPKPLLPRGWTDWKVWQFTSDGKVDGVSSRRTDLNRRKS